MTMGKRVLHVAAHRFAIDMGIKEMNIIARDVDGVINHYLYVHLNNNEYQFGADGDQITNYVVLNINEY